MTDKYSKYNTAIGDDKLISDMRIALSAIRPRPTHCQKHEISPAGIGSLGDVDPSTFSPGKYVYSKISNEYMPYTPALDKYLEEPGYSVVMVHPGKVVWEQTEADEFLPHFDIYVNGQR